MDPLIRNSSRRTAEHLWSRYRTTVLFGVLSAVVIAAVASGVWVFRSRTPDIDLVGGGADVAALSGAAGSHELAQVPALDVSGTLVVHVAGKVREPGIVSLPAGARVVDAIEAAGGFTKSAAPDAMNLAAPVVDGERVYVPSLDEVEPGGFSAGPLSIGGAGGGGTVANATVDINTAGAEQLESLPGIGPATSAKIIADRAANGRYTSLEDLMRVSGIGEKRVEALQGLAIAR